MKLSVQFDNLRQHADETQKSVQTAAAESRDEIKAACPTLSYFNEVDKGGHFAAWEEPELFTTELRAAFRPLR